MTPNEYLENIEKLVKVTERTSLESAVDMVYDAICNNKTIFVAGNGGSAATAEHFTADFGKNVVAGDDGRPHIMSLSSNTAAVTAYANDEGYNKVFSRQMSNFAEVGDLLIVISASGNSPNVVEAAEFMHKRGGKVIAMTGFSGGKLKDIADICLYVNDCHYESVEDLHSIFCHLIVSCIKAKYIN